VRRDRGAAAAVDDRMFEQRSIVVESTDDLLQR
jgi:hypothetical protein